MSKLTFAERAWEEYLYWQENDKKTLKRVNLLLKDIARNGNDGIGKPNCKTAYYQTMTGTKPPTTKPPRLLKSVVALFFVFCAGSFFVQTLAAFGAQGYPPPHTLPTAKYIMPVLRLTGKTATPTNGRSDFERHENGMGFRAGARKLGSFS